jgi:hypothetical protein
MDVMTLEECLYHVLIATETRHDAKFYLTVVARKELLTFLRYETATNLFAVLRAHRDILQVRVAG